VSHTIISGLRFRRVLLDAQQGYVRGEAPRGKPCDALICCRCTAVARDSGEAERHVCLSSYWCAGDAGSVEFLPLDYQRPEAPRDWVQSANHMPLTNLWPHTAKPFDLQKASPLSERYEALACLLAEMAKMEREIERNRRQSKKPRRRVP